MGGEGAEIAGVNVVVGRVLRRLTTVRGSLRSAPSQGLDIRSWVRTGPLTETPSRVQAAVHAELLRDPAVVRADVGVRWTQATSTLTLSIRCVLTETGPLLLVFDLSPAGSKVLVNGLPAPWASTLGAV